MTARAGAGDPPPASARTTPAVSRRAGSASQPAIEWLSVRDACAMLGVAPATIRRWAAAGSVTAFKTPGGHRRFSREAIAALLPTPGSPSRELSDIDDTSQRIALRYRTQAAAASISAPWLAGAPATAREPLREHGRAIAASLVTFLDAPGERERSAALKIAEAAAGDYGRISGALGASMRDTVAAFLRFRRPFVDGIADAAARRGLDAAGTAALLGATTEAIDRLLDATLAGHEAAAMPRTGR